MRVHVAIKVVDDPDVYDFAVPMGHDINVGGSIHKISRYARDDKGVLEITRGVGDDKGARAMTGSALKMTGSALGTC